MADANHIDSAAPSATATWNAAYSIVQARQALHDADVAFGAIHIANRAYNAAREAIEEKFGKLWRGKDDAVAAMDAAWAAMNEAELSYFDTFVKPLFDAQVALVCTPAVGMEGVDLKISLIRDYGIADEHAGRPLTEIIAEDIDRLTGVSL